MAKRVRRDISNSKIEEVFSETLSIKETAKILKCSSYLVKSCLDGIRKDPEPELKIKKRKRLCRCCFKNRVSKTNYFLCDDCYKGIGEGEVDSTFYIGSIYAASCHTTI